MNYKEPNIDPRLLKPYDPVNTEDKIYRLWEESGFFAPEAHPSWVDNPKLNENYGKYFSIILPPPNVTGVLHIGHAFEDAIQDVLVRYNRMQGKKTLWIPGTDHAAIATQTKVEKLLEKDGIRKNDLGREEFLKRVNNFAQESHDTIIRQLKKLGVSLDWSREAFTLDEKRSLAVKTAFKKMYDDGLIYRGHKIVNWDPKGQTVISDDEIVYKEQKAKLYTFKYSQDFPISISTTRPETKVGDTAVAVHPDDPRYKKYIGKTYVVNDFCGVKLEIKIVADAGVEKDFGTGALGVTPAHSQIDADIAEKNKLLTKQVINEFAKMIVGDERILGKKTIEAREIIVAWLKENNLLQKEEEVVQNISTAERSGGIIEPLPKIQWFVNVNKPVSTSQGGKIKVGFLKKKTLKELMLEPVKSGDIKILPERFERVYYNWIENLRDWCISRQLWYGHRIPVYYKGNEIYCGIEAPKEEGWVQDPDTLDTWFSSGLWTFSTLDWPDLSSKDLKNYHPTTILVTGYELIFFWMARMILFSKYLINQIPFKTVYFHGIVRDITGKKVSKSSGNNIDPIDIINEFGADALRMALIVGVGPGNDTKYDQNKVKAYKHFANKYWNITRFILSNTENIKYDENFSSFTEEDKKLIKERNQLIKEITKEMEEYKFYLVGEKIYQYVWSRLADVIIEDSKKTFENNDEKVKNSRAQFLLDTLIKITKILHPFMPFITEEVWSILPVENPPSRSLSEASKKLLMVEKWPLNNQNKLK